MVYTVEIYFGVHFLSGHSAVAVSGLGALAISNWPSAQSVFT